MTSIMLNDNIYTQFVLQKGEIKMREIVLKQGQTFVGDNYVGMINKIFGTHYESYMRSSVSLDKYGMPDYIAWIVYLNDEWHSDWKNSVEGNKITESCSDREKFVKDKYKFPNRLVFMRCPKTRGKSVFIGVATISKIDSEKMIKEYKLERKDVILRF